MIETTLADPRLVEITLNGETVLAHADATILDVCRAQDVDIPTMCFLETLTPFNSCRLCVVEVAGSRTLIPSCSRTVEVGMEITTESERVANTRRILYEMYASTVDLSLSDDDTRRWMAKYEVKPGRFGEYESHRKVKIQDDLYIRDYDKCVMCYRCVAACGTEAQNTFAIDVAGRGLSSTISTEFDVVLPDSACVYCGNCIGVCPTGALMFKSEYDMREAGSWDESRQTVTTTICSFCGVGCSLDLHVQDNRIVKVSSPLDHDVTDGHLCIKGRFGYAHIQEEAGRST
ncbi:MAG: 2Fe-2S iron-sulfur cluster-binding protein [Actinomycetota bacterium]|nr:2Fe-2S iron-sulfur cluster-binding protein [Actinomycetota bacterium]MDK1038284.1 2Fe-2S iron-sulfur cluster-binding protein [Actinomycetota bacterium]